MTDLFPNVKWLIQNGRSIIVRNLKPEKIMSVDLMNIRMDVMLEGENGKISTHYRSHTIKDTLNPTWTFSSLVAVEGLVANMNAAKLTLKLLRCDDSTKEEVTILTEDVDLCRLIPLKQPILNGKFLLPLNFLVINIEDELYATEKQYNIFSSRSGSFTGEVFKLDKDDEVDAEAQRGTIMANASAMSAGKLLTGLRKDVEASLKKAANMRLQSTKSDKQAELEQLRAQVETAEAELEQEKTDFAEEKSLFVASLSQQTAQLSQECRDLQAKKKEDEGVLNNKKLDLLKVKFLLEARKMKLLSELQTIYPIERVDGSGEYAIRGLELPADLYAKDDEQVAAALGYTVHLLLLASKYLEIPLRYQLLFMGSRSFIRDPVTSNGTTLPLFRRNVEKDRFDRAVQWLRRAVEQLLMARGVPYEPTQNLLLNVHALFQCEMCPKLSI